MKKIIVLLLLLIPSLYLNFSAYLDFTFGSPKTVLIEEWIAIHPGEPIADVIGRMGKYSYHIDKGQDWSSVKQFKKHIPETYRESHEVYVYDIGHSGTYVFFIFVNDEGNVAYTWAWST